MLLSSNSSNHPTIINNNYCILVNILLCLLGVIPGIIHALLIVKKRMLNVFSNDVLKNLLKKIENDESLDYIQNYKLCVIYY